MRTSRSTVLLLSLVALSIAAGAAAQSGDAPEASAPPAEGAASGEGNPEEESEAAEEGAGESEAAEAGSAEDRADSAEEAARRARVYARFDDATVTVGEIEDAIARQSPFLRRRYRDRETLRELAQDLLRVKLLAWEARRLGLDEENEIRRELAQALVQRFLLKEYDEPIHGAEIPEAELRAHYEENIEDYSTPEQSRASHILVATREEAEALIPEARGADLRKLRALVREHSMDTETRLSGGDLGFFTREGRPIGGRGAPVAEPIVEAAFAIEERGNVHPEPVAVEDKWSVVILTGRRPGRRQEFEQASSIVERRMKEARRREAIEALIEDLRRRVEPETHLERMRAIRLDDPPSTPAVPDHHHGGAGAPSIRAGGEDDPAEEPPTAE